MKKTIKSILKDKSDSILFAYFFGSHAQGTSSKNSDIDIAVFLKDSVYESFFDIKMDLYLNLSRTLKRNDIDLVIMNTCKNLTFPRE
ncbi:MAG: nucleotidyltransferase domain-containing protein [Proteobacteria bacterium]|nr:nucleotidyltransferase domain-containing protein [Pseudomonadota bacterium]